MNKKFGALAPTISDTYDTALYKFFICFNKFERHWKTLAKTMSLIISLSEPTVHHAFEPMKEEKIYITLEYSYKKFLRALTTSEEVIYQKRKKRQKPAPGARVNITGVGARCPCITSLCGAETRCPFAVPMFGASSWSWCTVLLYSFDAQYQ